jgi:hypothetical protein
MNREQQDVIEYLRVEIRVLREHVGPKRIPFTQEQRSRLAAKAKKLRFGRLNIDEIEISIETDSIRSLNVVGDL